MKGEPRKELEGAIVIAPPSAIADRWARRLPDPVICQASGWMRVKQRAKQGGIELPLVISDHADWDELLQTLDDVGAPKVWITHGREEALQYAAVVATGRSDYPNQINNVLAFPGVFRGLLDARAHDITVGYDEEGA